MLRLLAFFFLTCSVAGCVTSSTHSPEPLAKSWDFTVDGRLDRISVADLSAIVTEARRALQAEHEPLKIYTVHILSASKAEVETSPPDPGLRDGGLRTTSRIYRTLEHRSGRWQDTGGMIEMG